MEENLEDSAKRELREETGIGNLPMEQIAAYGNYDRDPRTRVITTAYRLSVKNQEKNLDTCAVVERKRHLGLICEESFVVKESGMIAVDHAAIIVQALTILQERCE